MIGFIWVCLFLRAVLATDCPTETPLPEAPSATPIPPTGTTISLVPDAVTLQPYQTQQFNVLLNGVNSNTLVRWRVTGGTISATGLFTAPAAPGIYLVSFTSIANTNDRGLATVFVNTTTNNTDVALGKPTTASSSFSTAYDHAKANDGNSTTRWCARAAGNHEWLHVNLGAVLDLSRSSVIFESNGVWRYKIEGAVIMNENWQVLVDKTQNTVAAQLFTDSFLNMAQVQHVRLTITETQTGHWASVYTWSLY